MSKIVNKGYIEKYDVDANQITSLNETTWYCFSHRPWNAAQWRDTACRCIYWMVGPTAINTLSVLRESLQK